jgi:hypothetical protein
MVLTLWPHSGVAGTLTWNECQRNPQSGHYQCSIKAALASITVTAWDSLGTNYAGTWTTKSDAAGRFHLDLPPGAYSLTAEIKGSVATNRGQTSFPVFANKITEVYLLLPPVYQEIKGGICLASTDRIATVTGPVTVSDLHPGMIVWTLDATGRRVATPVLQVRHIPTPPGYKMLHVSLTDGRVLDVSPGHPTVFGQPIGQLRPGDLLDGSHISTVELRPYTNDTWDLLPAGPTGVYWANDILLGSTLRLTPALAASAGR